MDQEIEGKYTINENDYNIETNWYKNEKIINRLGRCNMLEKLACYQEYDSHKRNTKEKFIKSLKDYRCTNSTNGTCSKLIDKETYKYKDANNLFICDSSTLQENPRFSLGNYFRKV